MPSILVITISILVLFAILHAIESNSGSITKTLLDKPKGLVSWLFDKNWPAKVGGILLTIGFGALIRLLFKDINSPPSVKLLSGIVASVALALYALKLDNVKNRAVQVALAGSSLGIALITVYSAYALFHVIPVTTTFGLFAAISVIAAKFAIDRDSMSIAVLTLIGGYLAPAFSSIYEVDANIVLGYATALTLLSAFIAFKKPWRALTQLSFIFSTGSVLFFGYSIEAWNNASNEVWNMGFLVFNTLVLMIMVLKDSVYLSSKKLDNYTDLGTIAAIAITPAVIIFATTTSSYIKTATLLALSSIFAVSSMQSWKYLKINAQTILTAIISALYALSAVWGLVSLGILGGLVLLMAVYGLLKKYEAVVPSSLISPSYQYVYATAALILCDIIFSLSSKHPSNLLVLKEVVTAAVAYSFLFIIRKNNAPSQPLNDANFITHIVLGLYSLLVLFAVIPKLNITENFLIPGISILSILSSAWVLYSSIKGKPLPVWIYGVLAGSTLVAARVISLLGEAMFLKYTTGAYKETVAISIVLLSGLGLALLSISISVFKEKISKYNDKSIIWMLLVLVASYIIAVGFIKYVETATAAPLILLLLYYLKLKISKKVGAVRPSDRPYLGLLVVQAWVLLVTIMSPITFISLALIALSSLSAYLVHPKSRDVKLPLTSIFGIILLIASSYFILDDWIGLHILVLQYGYWSLVGAVLAAVASNLNNPSMWKIGSGIMLVVASCFVYFNFDSLNSLLNIATLIGMGALFFGIALKAPMPDNKQNSKIE